MKKMSFGKSLAALTLAGLLALGGAACSPQTVAAPAPAETAAPAPQETAQTPETAAPFTPEGSVLFEKDGLKITTAGLDVDPTEEPARPIIWLDVENSSGQDAYLGVSSGSVNGWMTDVVLIEFYQEDGQYYGGEYDFSRTVPAGSSRYALGYYRQAAPGVEMDTLGEMEFCFTLAEDEYSWPNYTSEPVRIVTGETVEEPDIASFGTVVLDNDELLLVLGEQDYDDFFGPMVYVYAENRSNQYLGLTADSAEADGSVCDFIYYGAGMAPGKRSGTSMSFDEPIQGMKGFENLSVAFSLRRADSKDGLDMAEGSPLDPVSVSYPPRVWGEYENGGLRLEIQPRYNDLLTVTVPENDPDGILFSVAETASVEAGSFEGAGWLFSIGKVSEERLHQMLCSDMSGAEAFAKDAEGSYYVYYHPTDVRFERATPEEMDAGMAQWSMLCQWASEVPGKLRDSNGLEEASYGNSAVDMSLCRAAWEEGVKATLSTTEFGPVEIAGVDAEPYVEAMLRCWFGWSDREEAPDGEYVVLAFPEEDMRLDFFFAPGGFVRVVWGEREELYQAGWYDEECSPAEIMKGWYYAAAEKAGRKGPEESLSAFLGDWHEKIAGRGMLRIEPSLAPGKARIRSDWPESAAVYDHWEMTAALTEEGTLAYENGSFSSEELDEEGGRWQVDSAEELSGELRLNDAGELCWYDSHAQGDGLSTFVR